MNIRCGIFDAFFRPQDPSMTHYQPGLECFKYVDKVVDPAEVDLVMATWGSQRALEPVKHPNRVMYWQETTEARPVDLEWSKRFADQGGLVLANDQRVLDQVPGSKYQTLFGIRMPREHYQNPPSFSEKKGISLMGSSLRGSSGHRKRWEVFNARLPGVVPYGFDGRFYWKRDSLVTYAYTIVCESANYPYWHTEKLWDSFAMRTIPIYWGCSDTTRLREWGFDPRGIIFWDGDINKLASLVDLINGDPAFRDIYRRAVEWNHNNVLTLHQHEVSLYMSLLHRCTPPHVDCPREGLGYPT